MKEYKLKSLCFYSKVSLDKYHIIKSMEKDIQPILDEYAGEGWILSKTDLSNFGQALYVNLYFERDIRDLV